VAKTKKEKSKKKVILQTPDEIIRKVKLLSSKRKIK